MEANCLQYINMQHWVSVFWSLCTDHSVVTATALCWEHGLRSLEFPSSVAGAGGGGGQRSAASIHHHEAECRPSAS